MAIFSNQSGTPTFVNTGSLKVLLSRDITDGAILVFDYEKQAFVDMANSNPITSASSVGTGISIVSNKTNSTLNFKSLIAGDGISLTDSSTSIIISNNLSASTSVTGDYVIIFDNDNNDDDARFEIKTVRSPQDEPEIITIESLLPIATSSLYSGKYSDNSGYFEEINTNNFFAMGLRPEMVIDVTNAGNQSGTFTIKDVRTMNINGDVVARIDLYEKFENNLSYNLGGPKPNVTIIPFDLTVEHDALPIPYSEQFNYIVQSANYDFGPNGFDLRAGMYITFDDSLIDGTYLIEEVISKNDTSMSRLIFSPTTPIDHIGPIGHNAIKIIVSNVAISTGFYVKKNGEVHLDSLISNNSISIENQLRYGELHHDAVVTKDNVEEIRALTSKAIRYFYASI